MFELELELYVSEIQWLHDLKQIEMEFAFETKRDERRRRKTVNVYVDEAEDGEIHEW